MSILNQAIKVSVVLHMLQMKLSLPSFVFPVRQLSAVPKVHLKPLQKIIILHFFSDIKSQLKKSLG
jgi:hypothetical protein